MITADDCIEFCERYYSKGGTPFSIKGREWVRDEVFVPIFGWRVCARDESDLCSIHKQSVGSIVEWNPGTVETYAEKPKCCAGLRIEKITILILCLQRGAGKTTNIMGACTAMMALIPRMSIMFVASSGTQAESIARENVINAVASNKQLSKAFELRENRVVFARKREASSYMDIVNTSAKSLTSRRRQIVFFDEARGIPAKALSAASPSLKAASKFVCPNANHPTAPYAEDVVLRCESCGEIMTPVLPLLVLTSTSGERTGGANDWFDEMVEFYSENNRDNVHLFRSSTASNPSVNDLEDRLLDSLRVGSDTLAPLIDAEQYNMPVRKGEDFVASDEIRAVVTNTIAQKRSSEMPCVAYLDTSTVGDLTSLSIIEDDEERGGELWQYLRQSHIAVWNPNDSNQCPSRQVELDQVLAYLEDVLPRFPNLIQLKIDVRGMKKDGSPAWPLQLMELVKKGEALRGVKVEAVDSLFGRRGAYRKAAVWGEFQRRILARQYRTFPHATFERELRGLRLEIKNDIVTVEDRNRHVSHADVADAVANSIYMIWELQQKTVLDHEKIRPSLASFGEIISDVTTNIPLSYF